MSRRSGTLSIRLIVAVVSACITAAAVLLVGLVSQNKTRSVLTSEIEARLVLGAQHLALISSAELLNDTPALTLQPIIKNLEANHPEIGIIVVTDRAGMIQGHSDLRLLDTHYEPPTELQTRTLDQGGTLGHCVIGGREMLMATASVHDPTGNPIGQIQIGIYRNYIDDILGASKQQYVLLTALCLGLGVLITFVLMTTLLKPIGALKQGLARIGQGDLETRIDVTNSTDLGLLAEAVNDMAKRLKAHVDQLQQETEAKLKAQEALRVSEEKLMQSQKMEAIGQLAGGVAHDFNNILMSISGFASLILRKTEGDEKLHRYASEIGKSCDRAASLIKKLMAFSRKQVLAPRVIDLNQVTAGMLEMLQPLIGKRIQLQFQPDPDLNYVKADPVEIEQVIMNLVVNARDAMPEGGRILIETANQPQDFPESPPLGWALIRVTDTGSGIDEKTMKRIFEPFFTTKGQGKGTGLGLATVFGIVKQSGGEINVESEVGRGTTFTVQLPVVEKESNETAPETRPSRKSGGGETILVLEDEPSVREFVTLVLTNAGYTVLAAANGHEGVGIAENNRTIDLLLSDVMMPEMNGVEACQKIQEIVPGIPVLFMSGYAGGGPLAQEIRTGVEPLQKPFLPDQLLARVRQTIDLRRAA
jgi:signal transduction histidine kinase